MKEKAKKIFKLFLSTLYLSAFTFGGGYIIVSLMKKKFVDDLKWINEEEMLDLIAIAQSSPGAIAVNGAIVVGYKLAGVPGVLVSVLAAVIPTFVIIYIISFFYNAFSSNTIVSELLAGMQAGVGAVISSVVFDMGAGIVKEHDKLADLIMIAAFVATCFFKVKVIYVVVFCIVLGVIRTLIARREKI